MFISQHTHRCIHACLVRCWRRYTTHMGTGAPLMSALAHVYSFICSKMPRNKDDKRTIDVYVYVCRTTWLTCMCMYAGRHDWRVCVCMQDDMIDVYVYVCRTTWAATSSHSSQVCMYVCMHVYVHACRCICMYVYVCVCVYVALIYHHFSRGVPGPCSMSLVIHASNNIHVLAHEAPDSRPMLMSMHALK